MRGIEIVKRIAFGTIAFAWGKKVEKEYKNAWVCYVRGAEKDEDDISSYVKKVVFTLHESFWESVMIVDKHPFSITWAGWGQFDILITIYFHDPNEEPV